MITVLEPHHRAELIASGLVDDVDAWVDEPTGQDDHRWAQYVNRRITAVIQLLPQRRLRVRHKGVVVVHGPADAALLATVVHFADAWTPLDRLALALPGAHPLGDAAAALGFVPEVVRRRRLADATDEVLFGRLRPGFVPRVPGPPPAWPPPRAGDTSWDWRPMTDADVPAVQRLSVQPGVVWGTLQLATLNLPFCELRHASLPEGDTMNLLIDAASGAVAGVGGVSQVGRPGVRMIGMYLDDAWQGRGGGRYVMERLLAETASIRRVELQVWDDNQRAIALYRSMGFQTEGAARHDGIRNGGHASALEMALIRA